MKITDMLLTPNKYSRPQTNLESVKKIVVHWIGNAGSSAIENRNYFESLKVGKTQVVKDSTVFMYSSSHYVIGLKGEIIRCIPENEWAYTSNSANKYSISIECCHLLWDGKFTNETYSSLIELVTNLCKRYNLDPINNIIRHYDVTKKDCPRWFVNNPLEWETFKANVAKELTKKEEVVVETVSQPKNNIDLQEQIDKLQKELSEANETINKLQSEFVLGDYKVTYNGKEVKFDEQLINYKGRIQIPLRKVIEIFGKVIRWDEENKTAKISDLP